MTFPRGLPIDKYLNSITATVRSEAQVILTATPGAGKTTQLPPCLLDAVPGKIAVLQPRRVSALSACQFIADERGWRVGHEVGYQVRQEAKFSSETRLLFMTDAILIRRLIEDPELKDFDLIVIDEFHERNLNQDLILGIVKELQELGREIKILVMSATLDVSELTTYLPSSQVIDIPGEVYPLQIIYSQQPLSLQLDDNFIKRVIKAIMMWANEVQIQNILVFLPGVAEIQRVQNGLLETLPDREILTLHGSLPLAEQQKVLTESTSKRVILATNIAEASVTVPGVNAVIDSGLAKISQLHLGSGFKILLLTSIAKFNATQRSGRAARQMSGRCLRLWTIHEEASKLDQAIPEIMRSDLTITVLWLAFLGVSDPKKFSWFQKPPEILLKRGQDYLKDNGALTLTGQISSLGQRLLHYPLEPRFALIMLRAEAQNINAKLVCPFVALLQDPELSRNENRNTRCPKKGTYESRIFSNSSNESADSFSLGSSENSKFDFDTSLYSESDILARLKMLYEHKQASGSLKNHKTNYQFKKLLESSQQLQTIYQPLINKNNVNHKVLETTQDSEVEKLIAILVQTQSDRLCRRRGSSDRGLMVGGRGVRLSANSEVHNSEFFLALNGRDVSKQTETIIEWAHGLTKAQVLELLKDQITNHEDVVYLKEKGQFFLQKVRRIKDLDLEEPSLSILEPDQIDVIMLEQLSQKWIEILVQNWEQICEGHRELSYWIKRWSFYDPESKVLTSEHIQAALEMVVGLGFQDMTSFIKQDLVYFLELQIANQVLSEFNKIVPSYFLAPSGIKHPIIYSEQEDPFVEVRLQEVFGLTLTPKIGLKNQPLVLKLLAPNFRPVQVTSDIEGFWDRSYFEIRKELRGRYPKHSWPEDPRAAQAVAKGRSVKRK